MEQLTSMINDYQNNYDLDLFNSLLIEVDLNDLERFRAGGQTLLQRATSEGKADLVRSLLEAGMDVNGLAEATTMTPVLLAASKVKTKGSIYRNSKKQSLYKTLIT
jgi:ankyrin repeat protein